MPRPPYIYRSHCDSTRPVGTRSASRILKFTISLKMSQDALHALHMDTLSLLEWRLRRLEFMLSGDMDNPHSRGNKSLQQSSVQSRIEGLEKALHQLTLKSEVARELVHLRKDRMVEAPAICLLTSAQNPGSQIYSRRSKPETSRPNQILPRDNQSLSLKHPRILKLLLSFDIFRICPSRPPRPLASSSLKSRE